MPEDLSLHRRAQQRKPGHCSGLSARKISDKNADMDYHAILLPQYQAGRDSKRENLCQQDSERANKTTPGTSSSWRPVAREDPSSEKKVHFHPNTDREKYMRKVDHPANKFEPHWSTIFTLRYGTVYVQDSAKRSHQSSRFPAQRCDVEPIY